MRNADFHWNCAILTILLATNVTAFAATPENQFLDLGLEDLANVEITSATGTSKPLRLAPSVASVVTAEDIKAMGAKTVAEALEFVPGVHVSKSFNRLSDVFVIRGVTSLFNSQVLFLINGKPIKDIQTQSRPGNFNMPTANISRIEIIRGPGSAVHGADAFSGVINVITKTPGEINGTIMGGRIGSFNSKDAWLQTSGDQGGWKSALSFEYISSDGDRRRTIDTDAQRNLFDNINLASSRPRSSITPGPLNTKYDIYNTTLTTTKDNWNIWFNSYNMRTGVGAGVAAALDNVGKQDTDMYSLSVDYSDKKFSDNVELVTNFFYSKLNYDVYYQLLPPGGVYPVGADGNLFTAGHSSCPMMNLGQGLAPTCLVFFPQGVIGNPGARIDTSSLEVAFNYRRFQNHLIRLAFGGSYSAMEAREKKNFGPGVINGTNLTAPNDVIDGRLTDVTGTSGIYIPNKSRSLAYMSLQDEWGFAPNWELTGGVRYDNYSDFGETVNPRLALVWATSYNLTTKMLYGKAFRAPSFGELYYINNPSAAGDPNIHPETMDMYELAFDYRPTLDLSSVINTYKYRVDGLIDLISGQAKNTYNIGGYGLEADIAYKMSKNIKLLTNYAWQHSENTDTNEAMANVPKQQASAGLRYQTTQSCAINTKAKWVSGRKRSQNDSRQNIADYTTVDFIFGCVRPKNQLGVTIALRNAFNQDAREPAPYNPNLGASIIPHDYPLEGRNAYIEMSYKFK